MNKERKCNNPTEGEFVKQFYSKGNTLANEQRAERHMSKCKSCLDLHMTESREVANKLPVGNSIGKTSVPRRRIREVVRKVMREDGMIP